MKKQNWWGGCFAALVVLNCMPLTVAGADLTLERARQQLLGEWQVGFHPESDDTTANRMSFDNRHFGRYDDRIFVCD